MTANSLEFERIQTSLARQGMMQHLGEFHGGAMGALADIAGGYAGLTVAPEGMEVTTAEYKINFLASFNSGELRATGKVVRAGKRVIVTTAEVLRSGLTRLNTKRYGSSGRFDR